MEICSTYHRGAQAKGKGPRSVEFVFAFSFWFVSVGVCSPLRDHRSIDNRPRVFQLQCPRHWQHGNPASICNWGPEKAVAGASAGRKNQINVRDDWTSCGFIWCYQYVMQNWTIRGWQELYCERTQVVVEWSWWSQMQSCDRDGNFCWRTLKEETSKTFNDHCPYGCTWCENCQTMHSFWLRRCPTWPYGGGLP